MYIHIVVNENILQLIAIFPYPILSSAHSFNAGNTKKTIQLLNLAPQTWIQHQIKKSHFETNHSELNFHTWQRADIMGMGRRLENFWLSLKSQDLFCSPFHELGCQYLDCGFFGGQ